MLCFEGWAKREEEHFEIIPTVFSLFSAFCDAIDEYSLKHEIGRICVLDDSHTDGFSM